MAIELHQLNVTELRDTVDPVLLHVPASPEEAILIGCNPRLIPDRLVLAVHKRSSQLRVLRTDGGPIQALDAKPIQANLHLPSTMLRSPTEEFISRFDTERSMWLYEDDANVANSSLLSTFAYLIGNFAVSRQSLQLATANPANYQLH
jgi:hypothetical protein